MLLVVAVMMICLAQPMALDASGEAALQGLRKVALELARQVRIGGAAGVGQRMIERDLAVGEQQREFGARQAASLASALFHLLVGRQELDRSIDLAVPLEPAQQLLMLAQVLDRAPFHQAQGLALQVVVAQYQRGDLGSGRGQQAVAARAA